MSVDRIALTGLRVTGHHGVLPQELRDGQEFIIDAVLGVATAAGAARDCLAQPAGREGENPGHKPRAPVSQPLDEVTVTISRSRVVLALGSNLGDRLANLQCGLDVLGAAPGLHWLGVSPVYET